jgi:hypothetical protein
MNRFLTFSLIKSFIISCITVMIAYQIVLLDKDQTLEGKQAFFIDALAGIFWVFVLLICSLTVYLNNANFIIQKALLRTFSFFLIPSIATIGVWFWGHQDGQWITFYIGTITFFLCLSFFYYRFLQHRCYHFFPKERIAYNSKRGN